MNSLSRAITAQFLNDDQTALRKHWSTLMNSSRKHELMAAHHLLYLTLLGKDWRKGFTPPTNRRKLENGALQGWTLFSVLRLIHGSVHSHTVEQQLLAPFDEIVTPQALQQIRQVLPRPNVYAYTTEDFADGILPFDAYNVPEEMHAATRNPHVPEE